MGQAAWPGATTGSPSKCDHRRGAARGDRGTTARPDHQPDRPSGTRSSDLLDEFGPDGIVRWLAALDGATRGRRRPISAQLPHLFMPAHYDVRPGGVILRPLYGALAATAERGPADFADLLLVPGVGVRTMRSLDMVAQVIHGAPCRFADPARCALAHGGKDRKPFWWRPRSTTIPSAYRRQPWPAPSFATSSGWTRSADWTSRPGALLATPRTPRWTTMCVRKGEFARPWRAQRPRLGATCGQRNPGALTPSTPAATERALDVLLKIRRRTGAGEGIRTLDPNLGKVVLYP